jgi:ADP-ribose pyrophosphatase YjhB (NUDIX family)
MTEIWYVVNVEGMIFKDGRYLMIVRGDEDSYLPGVLAPVGGKVEGAGNYENVLEDTLRREIREEVGIEIEPQVMYVESKSFVTDDGTPVVDVVFLCRYKSGEAFAAAPGEVAEVNWLTVEEIMANPKTPPWTRSSIEAAERIRIEKQW